MPVSLMKAIITPSEFLNWVTYLNTIEPDVQEIQMAILSLQVAQGLGSKSSKLEDFLINMGSRKPKAPAVLPSAFDSFAAASKPFKGG